jgi:pimeloyl-ACP methyl ester carboxylesterase
VLGRGPEFQSTVDSTEATQVWGARSGEAKYYDIIGFDPRGVNHTLPAVECYPSSLQRFAWKLQNAAEGRLGEESTSLEEKWARYESRSKSCMASVATMGEDSIAYHTNVAPVARDILEIAERHGEWREIEVRSKIATAGRANHIASQSLSDDQESRTLLERLRWLPGQEKVQYWGISYGTALGATLATMYPDRIHRAILDSVVVASDWVPALWMKSLQDTDKTLALFCNYCYLAGNKDCKLWRESPEAIAAAFEEAHLKLSERPISVPGNHARGPDVVNHNDLKRMFAADAIYHPISGFPMAAMLIADVLQGNGSSFADYKAIKYNTAFKAYLDDSVSGDSACQEMGPYSQACQTPNEARDERSPAIWCLEAENNNMTRDYFQQFWSVLKKQSELMGDIWAERRLECVGWNLRPAWPFTGEY